MKRFEKVLFPTDFKRVSKNVTENAFEFARRFSRELHFFHAELLFENDPHEEEAQFPERALELVEREEARHLDEMLETMSAHPLEIHRHEQRAISAAPAILEFTRQQDFDLIIAGTHGRKGFSRWCLGSVAEAVLAGSDRPMLIIKDQLEMGLFQNVRQILAPIYLHAQCRPTLALAFEMAKAFQASLHVLHVIPTEIQAAGLSGSLIFDLPLADLERIEAFVAEYQKASETPVHLHSASGSVVQEILEHGRRLSAGLIVMGHRDRVGFSERMKGGITELVMRDATCPIMTTPLGMA